MNNNNDDDDSEEEEEQQQQLPGIITNNNNNNKRRQLLLIWKSASSIFSFTYFYHHRSQQLVAFASSTSTSIDTVVEKKEFLWNDIPSGRFPMAVNGKLIYKPDKMLPPSNATIKIRYNNIPKKKKNSILSYYNITVYQKTGTSKMKTISKYAESQQHRSSSSVDYLPISRMLDIGDRGFITDENLKQNLNDSEFINVQKRIVVVVNNNNNNDSQKQQQQQEYYDFEYINKSIGKYYFISTTIVNQRLYVMLIECSSSSQESSRQQQSQQQQSRLSWNSNNEEFFRNIQRSFQVESII